MREIISLNNNWNFSTENPLITQDRGWEVINLPHTNKILPYNGFDEKEYQIISYYNKELFIPDSCKGRTLLLHFEGVMTACIIRINGVEAGVHLGGYTAFDVNITSFVSIGKKNNIDVEVDSREREEIPPFGKVIDYLTYGGIYREVSLKILNPIYIENIFARPGDILNESKKVETTIFLKNDSGLSGMRNLKIVLSDNEKELYSKTETITLKEGSFKIPLSMAQLKNINLWELYSPQLYTLHVSINHEGEQLDSLETKIGFRLADFRPGGFFLNNKLVKIRGLNRHQAYPYSGYAMPWRAQKRDADILKFELGVNLVRTSHYPQSRHFLDRCDEIGLLVFEEIPGWQHIGNKEWQDNACLMVEEMIKADWNRPSVIIWGVRINESEDNHEFYKRTNNIARNLDGSRQTGGVRYTEKSEFLEDVYGMNDFIHSGGKEILRTRKKVTGRDKLPYLITEHNGHMFPTKRFDQEERLQEHALRHLKILNHAMGDNQISGAVGWCAFDYNTHREFGSGDRICYHGVSDMFRIPKYAAAV